MESSIFFCILAFLRETIFVIDKKSLIFQHLEQMFYIFALFTLHNQPTLLL